MITIEQNQSLQHYTTFGIDVLARHLVFIKDKKDISELLTHPLYQSIDKRLILWWGSNILLTQDFEWLVMINQIHGKKKISEDDISVSYTIASGELWDDIVWRSVNHNYLWIENLVSIPWTLWWAPVQNIGAYGVEICDVIQSVWWIDMKTGKHTTYSKEECNFWYRTSIFKEQLKEDFFITEVTIRLSKSTDTSYKAKLNYNGIKETLSDLWHEDIEDNLRIQHNSQSVSQAIALIRASKLPNRRQLWTAWSFFANPILSAQDFGVLKEKFPDLIGYKTDKEWEIKASAWQLIEWAGLKWYRDWDAWVYERHALVLVNHGTASGEEMSNLIKLIQETVYKKYGILLVPEVNIL